MKRGTFDFRIKPVTKMFIDLKQFKDLLEAAEEMYEYVEPTWNQAEKTWVKAAIEAARKEIE